METFTPGPLVRTAIDLCILTLLAGLATWLFTRWPVLRALRARMAALGLLTAVALAAVLRVLGLAGAPVTPNLQSYGDALTLILATAALALLLRRLIGEHRDLAAARSARERFLAQIGHELRTPLNSIIGFSQLSRSLLDKGRADPSVFAGYQADIERSAGHLGRLLDDFADLAALEAGRLTLAREPVDLSEKVRCCDRLMRAGAEAKGLAFRVEGAAAPRWVQADPARVRQALVNVINNAVLYTDAGEVAVSFIERPVSWGVVVRDTGAGIAGADLARLLEPLERGAESPLHAADGPGLGLAIVHELMRAMHGRLEIESVPGDGTTVRLVWQKAARNGSVPAASWPGHSPLSEPA